MIKNNNFFWQNLKSFSNQIACIDTSINKSVTYSELEIDSEKIAEKIKLSSKGFVFLFTSNTMIVLYAYLGILKSGNAVLLLMKNLNNEIRNDLVNKYNPEFIITSKRLIH